MLVIGSKLDLAEAVRDNAARRTSSIAEECGADEVNLVRAHFSLPYSLSLFEFSPGNFHTLCVTLLIVSLLVTSGEGKW